MELNLAAAKRHLSLADDYEGDDALIAGQLAAAIALVEARSTRILAPRTITQSLRRLGDRRGDSIALFYGPVTAIDGFSVALPDGTTGELAVDEDFRLVSGDAAQLLPPIGASWPAVEDRPGAASVQYVAGYAAGEVPDDLGQAVLMLVGHFYLNREAVAVASVNGGAVELPLAVTAICDRYRSAWIG